MHKAMIRLGYVLLFAALGPLGCGTDSSAPAAVTADQDIQAGDSGLGPSPEEQGGEPAPGFDLEQRVNEAAAAVPAWTPATAPTSPEGIAASLALAAAALAEGRLEAGEGNALGLYAAVVEAQPDNVVALAGLDAVVDALLLRGEGKLVEGRHVDAARIAQRLVQVRPSRADVRRFEASARQAQEIALRMEEGRRLAAAGKEVARRGDSAASMYQQVLLIQPDNAEALAALVAIETGLVDQAIAAADAGEYARSDQLLASAGLVRPGSAAVQDASIRVVELRQSRASSVLDQANVAIAGGELDRAAELLARLETVSVQSEGIEDLRSRIENARLYGSHRPGEVFSDPLASGGSGPELVVMPIGSFQMGSPASEPDRRPNEGPVRRISFSRGFALGKAEVSVGEYRAFVRASGFRPSTSVRRSSTIYDEKSGSMTERSGVTWESDHVGKRAADTLPVTHVAWADARAYVDWLASETGKSYRLPSEAEFEYALRAGGQTRYPWGDDNPTRVVDNVTGQKDRSASGRNWVNAFPDYDDGYWGPAPTRHYDANAFGVHGLVGNVSEWVEDCWHDNYQRAPSDGSPWVNPGCSRRVVRGASWASSPEQVRSAFRLAAAAETTNARLGFRIARDL